MNEGLVERWNETVGPDDVVWHLGDFAIRQRPEMVAAVLARLRGHKHLLTGNNDPPGTTELDGWDSVQPYAEITVDGVSAVLCHYPFRSWRGMDKGWVTLHGHSHGRLKPQPRQFDVGVDVWGFRPVTSSTERSTTSLVLSLRSSGSGSRVGSALQESCSGYLDHGCL